MDIPEVAEIAPDLLKQLAQAAGHKRVLALSAASHANVPMLMARLLKLLQSAPPESPPSFSEPRVALDDDSASSKSCNVVDVAPGVWWVSGDKIEKAAAMTNWDYHEAQERFQRIMQALGVSEELKAAGAKSGDTIMVGNVDFKYYEETAMAVRARLAGYGDLETTDDIGEMGDERDAERRRRRAEAIDKELRELLDSDGDVTLF